jgi:hypothetical protein
MRAYTLLCNIASSQATAVSKPNLLTLHAALHVQHAVLVNFIKI